MLCYRQHQVCIPESITIVGRYEQQINTTIEDKPDRRHLRYSPCAHRKRLLPARMRHVDQA
jgi:hypothetical protein